jgi:Fur family transcriptional regulator, ferric uptake regulator
MMNGLTETRSTIPAACSLARLEPAKWLSETTMLGRDVGRHGTNLDASLVSALMSNAIEELCAAKGMRMTEQRRTIARVLAGSADHPDVEELYRRCAKVDDRISISTVYRTVKLFEDAGIIERHDFREGRARYEQIPESHHDHLINLRTGEVIEFQSEEIERLQAEVARRLGYKLVDHRLELYAIPLDDEKQG